MRLAVAVTVKNERRTIGVLLDALAAQTRPADEVVVVDAGSTDGTYDFLCGEARVRAGLKVLRQPGISIGAGRNAAIDATTAVAVAVTDGGCRPDPGWLAALAGRLESGAAVVAGVFVPEPASRFERMVSLLLVRPLEELTPAWDPSSRSMAFTKAAWSAAGGYPENVPTAEDTLFCKRLRALRCEFVLEKLAIVRWRPRTSFRDFAAQYRRYAYGDALAGTSTRHYVTKMAIYAWFLAALLAGGVAVGQVRSDLVHALGWPILLLWVASWVAYHLWFAGKMLARGAGWLATAAPLLMTTYDLAEIQGFLGGVRDRRGRGLGAA